MIRWTSPKPVPPGLRLAVSLALAGLAVLSAPLAAQEQDDALEARVEALEQLIRDQHAQFEEQRGRMEETIREQQRDLEDQRRQLSAQYELIQELQGEAPSEKVPEPLVAARETQPEEEVAATAKPSASSGQQAAEAELVRREAAGEQTRKVDAQATLYDPSNTVFDPEFPGAWHLPGTTAAMRIGGFVNLGLVTSLDPVAITDRFIVGSIPPDGKDVVGARAGTDVTARQSRLNFEVREQTSNGTLRAFIEGDFEGEGETFRLRHAFGQYNYLLAGKTWSTFANVNALPEEVDFEGVNGVVLRRQPQLRVFPTFGKDMSFVFSIEEPGTDIVNGEGSKGNWDFVASVDRLPLGDLGGWNYRLSAVLRDLEGQFDEDEFSGTDGTVPSGSTTGWGITTSGRKSIPAKGEDGLLLWQLTYGEGIGRYLNDLATVGGGDAVFDPEGNLRALPVLAGFVSYRHHWEARPWFLEDWPGILRSNFTLSYISIDNYEFQDDLDYAETLRASTNLLYFPTQNLRLGAELLWGQRKNKDGSKGDATQVQVSARYNF